MERSAYTLLEGLESSWWYRGRIRTVAAAAAHAGVPRKPSALDYGAGYGGMRETCSRFGEAVDAFEPDETARNAAALRGYGHVFSNGDSALAEHRDAIGIFDVLEHIEDDRAFLVRARETLGPSGHLIITVPAFMSLWSAHDTEHHHYRRYTRSSLAALLRETGYDLEYTSYWNCLLFIPAAILRLAGGSGGSGLTPPRLINTILFSVVTVESAILRYVPLPFGLSIVAIARVGNGEKRPGSALMKKIGFLARYAVSGLAGGVIQTASLFVWVSLLGLKEAYLLGLCIGFVLALIASFALQKYWTFRDRDRQNMPGQMLSYAAVALSGLALNAALLAGAKSLAVWLSIDFFNGWYLLAQGTIVCIVSAFNFGMNSFVTFRRARRERSWER